MTSWVKENKYDYILCHVTESKRNCLVIYRSLIDDPYFNVPIQLP